VEALDDGLDGMFGHQCGVLADGGEIDEGQPGDVAVVVAHDGYIAGDVDVRTDEGVEDAMGASVVGRENGRGQLPVTQGGAAGDGAGFFGVVPRENPFLMLKAVPSHGPPVSAAALGGCGLVAAVDVDDAAVAEVGQVVYGQPGAALVGYSYDI